MNQRYLALLITISVTTGIYAIEFSSSDHQLEKSFYWAKHMALSYSHENDDTVGYWYEAALPNRNAFCMRDVAHQSAGGHLLGLDKHNKNMMRCFVSNVTEGRDWCSLWEIDKWNRPCPEDYENDSAFWYVLNANFDILQACLKLYQWTGDQDFISDSDFENFYEVTFGHYLEHWSLTPDKIMRRPSLMNMPHTLLPINKFYRFRGLPSYVENIPGITVSADLIASIYAGCKAYARMMLIRGNQQSALKLNQMAEQYQTLLETKWWDNGKQQYRLFKNSQGTFETGGGGNYILWFEASNNAYRVRQTLNHLTTTDMLIEDTSYLPLILYKCQMNKLANQFVRTIPYRKRSEYPQVSYSMVESIVSGLMGIEPDYANRSLKTLYRGEDSSTARLKDVPLWDGSISLSHRKGRFSMLENNTKQQITWKATFTGIMKKLDCNGTIIHPKYYQDIFGNHFTQATVKVPANCTMKIICKL